MVRLSSAIIVGSLLAVVIATASFLGGWSAAQANGNVPLSVVISSFTRQPDEAGERSLPGDSFAIFWDVWDLVQREFYRTGPLDQQAMVYGAIRGMLASLGDDYTGFQEPAAATASRESLQGRFEGIGAYLKIENGAALIDRPIKNSPAAKAGLQSDDIIVAIDGAPVAELISGLNESEATAAVVSKIRGPRGSSVTLTLRRPPAEATFDVSIVRDEVPLISVNAQMLAGGVAYIQITEFKAPTADELDAALRELLPQQPTRIILDLRNNPGGYLNSAQQVLGRFYEGVALYEQHSNGTLTELKTMEAPQDARVFDLPVVVLINGGSASASEIVAGALRDQRPNTVLMGEKSFGKGSVQNIHQLRDGSSVRITIAHWFTPAKSEIHKIGITPQYVVAASQDAAFAVPCIAENRPPDGQSECSDAQLAAALRFLRTGVVPQ